MVNKVQSRRRVTYLLFASLFVCFAVLSILLRTSDQRTNIRADGKGYYLYLPALVIHHDLSMQWTVPLQNADVHVSGVTEWYGVSPAPHGRFINKYSIGLSILWAPFFLAAHIITHLVGGAADGFSAAYQAAIGLAAITYASLGCLLLFSLLKQYFSIGISLLSVLIMVFATNLLSYIVYDSSFTHVYSFFLMSFLLYMLPRWYAKMSYRNSALLGLLLGLGVLVRQTNVLIVIVVLLWGVKNKAEIKQRFRLLSRYWRRLMIVFGTFVVCLLPQLAYWHYATGHWLVFSYKGEYFHFLHPQLMKILLSTDRGALFWAPILILPIAGIFMLRKKLAEWYLGIWVFLTIWLWVVSSWHSWQFGFSYGHRIFIDIYPLLALPLALVLQTAWKRRSWRWSCIGFIGLCIVVNLFLSYQYWVRELAPFGTTLRSYGKVWQSGGHQLTNNGLGFGLLGLIAVVGLSLCPIAYYYLIHQRDIVTK